MLQTGLRPGELLTEVRIPSAAATDGQPLATSFLDYLLPTLIEVLTFDIGHVEIPPPFTAYGVKGGGEGGRVIAPTALASAIEDAQAPLEVRVDELSMTPERIVSWI